MPVANIGYLHWRGRKVCTLSDLRASLSVFRQKISRKIRQMQLAPSVMGNSKKIKKNLSEAKKRHKNR